MPKLGDLVRDRVSGLCGIVTALAKNLDDTDTCLVVPPAKEEREYTNGSWFACTRLEVVRPAAVEPLHGRE